jgi:hypothetical protein
MDCSSTLDWYETLGVSARADGEQIHAAYRHLAKRHHPDAGGDAEMFKLVSEAYRVLGDDALRREYDAARGASSASAGTATHHQTRPADPTPRDDVYDTAGTGFAGAGRSHGRSYPGSIPRVVRTRGTRNVGVARAYLLRAWIGGAVAGFVAWQRSAPFRPGAQTILDTYSAGVAPTMLRDHILAWGVSAWLLAAGACGLVARISRQRRRWWIEPVAVVCGLIAVQSTPYPALAALCGVVLLRGSIRREPFVEYA